jgi:hypothetical protein
MKDYYIWFLVLFILVAGCFVSHRMGYAAGKQAGIVRYISCHDGQCHIIDPACVNPDIRAQFEGGK